MSRPHDGQRTFFPFGNPFRMILPKGSYLSPKLLLLLNSFEQTLAESLKKLKLEDISDVLSLSWMRHAMEFLSETHTNIKTLITDLKFPVSDWDEKWVDIYLDSSVNVLDICIALISELSRLDQGQLLLQYISHILDYSNNSPSSEQLDRAHASLHDWIEQAHSRSPKLENCPHILEVLAGTLSVAKVKNSSKGKVLMRALYGVKVVTIYFCSILAAALSGCSKPLMELRVSDEFLWAKAFNDLQADVNTEIRSRFASGKITVLHELEAVEECAESLHILTVVPTSGRNSSHEEERERFEQCVSELGGRAERLTVGLDALSKQVGDFFQIVLTGRDALLCNLREPDVMQDGGNEEKNRL